MSEAGSLEVGHPASVWSSRLIPLAPSTRALVLSPARE